MSDDALRDAVVLVTRPREQAEALSDELRRRGALPIEAPAIRIEPVPDGGPLDDAISAAAEGAYDWVAFTSSAGVEAWFDRAGELGLGASDLPDGVAAVGTGTAEALRARRRAPDLVPETFTTEALGQSFPEGEGKVLLPRADVAPSVLEEALRDKGWEPVRVDAYRTVLADSLPAEARDALADGRVDAVTFTSASTVRGFVAAAGVVRGPAVVCIGPVTAQEAREAGLRVTAVADPHTVGGLVAAVADSLARPRLV